ncbi:hypothetical protein L596_005400 [Steinernema carpocapsae]|uniref:Insulin-like domain-containing protein n=1 Tax=Steinernema carpocapsae TaxID=34508 RepID=A0A4U8V2I6_STECR|nr:hypothetical protein L596_005400 [Steinernema carpocapsae]
MVAAIRSDTLVLMLCALLLLNYPAETEANVRLCGVKLTRTLMGICRGQVCGGFMGPSMIDKRSEPSSPQNIANQNVAHFMSLAKRSGIATECCHRRCSFNYLKTYCC